MIKEKSSLVNLSRWSTPHPPPKDGTTSAGGAAAAAADEGEAAEAARAVDSEAED